MPFGLTNTPAMFMTLMDSVLKPYLGKFVVVFLDDILIYSRTKEEHIDHLRKIFELLQVNKLYAKESKCEFFATKIHYLGHIISDEGIKMEPSKIEAIMNWPSPTNLKEIQVFLGLAGFYRKFVKDYAKVAVPLTDQLKAKGCNFFWGKEQQRSFDRLKLAIATAPLLSVVDPHKSFVVEIDASATAIGAVLLQDGRPVAYESKKLNDAQRNYSAYERELFAIVHALKTWRHYLYGAPFEVLFDHKSIKWFLSQKDLKGRKARWAEFLQEFDCTLRYRKG